MGYFIKPYTTYSRQRVKNTFAYRLEALEKQMITYKNLKDKIVKVISFERGALLNLQSVCASYI
ncbi:MAG: hypothetical protein LBQ24_05255 [Candidatus Peribacteria bacterium]|nr:hypothetical protein [Candidatus Peribacteria bacterium]